ncbi:MAG: hypothetical protein V3W41_20295 [Planctomycetota bacterium]
MRLIHADGSIEILARPIQKVARQWDKLSADEATAVFQEAFTEASLLPNYIVLEQARAHAEEQETEVPVALVAVNDLWSVYSVASTTLAIAVQDGETLSLATFTPQLADEIGIPWPR